ncbi:TPA: hypothetical protein O8U43_004486 [Enterobacter cloacae]|nr:hypothetical protein [Enterobacter cloacae]
MSMYVDNITGEICFHKNLALTPFITKKEIMESNCLNWEPWPDKGDKTVSYRTIFDIKGNKQGDIYLIVNFVQCNDINAIIGSWSFAPAKLIDGEQKKPEGKVTKRLRDWFKEKTNINLPIYGSWGHIDASYDYWNCSGTIFCNYRSSFRDDKSWKAYCKWNSIKL